MERRKLLYHFYLKASGERMDLKEGIKNFRESENFYISLARDIASVAAAVLLFSTISYLIFGMWTPMVAVESGSMEPHMNIGDIIFIQI
jgi:signal peptidase